MDMDAVDVAELVVPAPCIVPSRLDDAIVGGLTDPAVASTDDMPPIASTRDVSICIIAPAPSPPEPPPAPEPPPPPELD